MSQVDFRTFKSRLSNNNTSSTDNYNRVSYFSLKDDGDDATVRFMIDSVEDFSIVLTHPVKINGFIRSVNCPRDFQDPVEKCPLCEAGVKSQYKFFIKMLQYTKDENGQVVVTPKIWERSSSYADTFNNLLSEYGPLSDQIFKIKRRGAAGSRDTSYDIMYCNQANYPANIFRKDVEAFKNYKLIGHAVLSKDYEGLCDLASQFKEVKEKESINNTEGIIKRTNNSYKDTFSTPFDNSHAYSNPEKIVESVQEGFKQAPPTPLQVTTGFERPRRFY